jgi:hypothetical protein
MSWFEWAAGWILVDTEDAFRLGSALMPLLHILVGIGLMLVSSLSYALPPIHEFSALYPAFAGIVIGTVGFVCRRHARLARYLSYMNGMAAVMILIWASLRIAIDAFFAKHDYLMLTADADTICLCGLLIHQMVKEWINGFLLDRQEVETLHNLESK